MGQCPKCSKSGAQNPGVKMGPILSYLTLSSIVFDSLQQSFDSL